MNPRFRTLTQDLVSDCLDEVSFSQSDTAVDEEGIITGGITATAYSKSSCVSKLIIGANYEVVESIIRTKKNRIRLI